MGRGEQGGPLGSQGGGESKNSYSVSVCHSLSSHSPPPHPPAIVLEGDEWKIRPDDLESKAHLGGKPGIHLFLARSWTD